MHCFDPDMAKEHGVNAAILFQNIKHWVEKNEANGRHFYEGQYWTYNSNNASKHSPCNNPVTILGVAHIPITNNIYLGIPPRIDFI